MNLLKTTREQDIFPAAPIVDTANFRVRKAARAIVMSPDGSIYLVRNGQDDYHKIPGGGVEGGEDIKKALRRELMEEIGCKAVINAEIGEVVEFRDQRKLKQISYCYLAEQEGEQTEPEFDEGERARGFEVLTVPDIDSAISTLEADQPEDYEGKFIQDRDLVFLKKAKEILGSGK